MALPLRGVLADDEYLPDGLRVERQHALLVLREHDGLLADEPRDLLVPLRVALPRPARSAGEEARLRHHVEDVERHLVDGRLGDLPGLHGVDERIRPLLRVEVVYDVVAAVHLDSAAGVGGELVGVLPAPVRLEKALEAPLVAQYPRLEVLVLGRPESVDLVVGRHHAEDPRLLHGRAERGEVYLVERPQVAVRVHRVAVPLLVVEAEVLDRRGDVVALHAPDHRHAHPRGEARVLAEVLPVASVERRARDVYAGAEQLVHPAVAHLRAEHLSVEPRHLRVPGGREGGERRKLRVLAPWARVAPVPAVHLRADGRRVVAHRPLLLDADARDRGKRHRAGSAREEHLLLERHLRKGLARRLDGGRVVEHGKTGERPKGRSRRNS